MKVRTFLKRWWPPLGVSLIVLVIIIFFALGYRLGPGLSIVRVGSLVIEDIPAGATVYVDEVYNRTSAGGDTRITLLPGSHSVIVSVEEHQPWNELVSISSDAETRVRPFIMPTKFGAERLTGEDATEALARIRATRLPTISTPLTLAGGCASVYVSGNRIVAEAVEACVPPPYLVCVEESCGPTVIFSPVETLHAVVPLPGRDDALVVSAGNTLFVLELDPREPEFFAPIIRGKESKVAVWNEGSIVVSQGADIFRVPL